MAARDAVAVSGGGAVVAGAVVAGADDDTFPTSSTVYKLQLTRARLNKSAGTTTECQWSSGRVSVS